MNTIETTESTDTLAAGDRFFVQTVALDAAAPAAGQVELALEEHSPFPLAQLYHGFVTSADGSRAIAFAAYRRRFTPEEQTEWSGAGVVVPDFLALFGTSPSVPTLVVHTHAAGLNAVAWDGKSELPVAVVARAWPEPGDAEVTDLIAELRGSTGLADAQVRRHEGPVGIGRDDAGDLIFRIAGEETARLPAVALVHADVRDKGFLADRRREQSEGRRWWLAFLIAAALLIVALGLEIGAAVLGVMTAKQRAGVEARAEEVRRIETAQTLAVRIEDLVARQQRPLEWLAQAAAVRPKSIHFLRMAGRSDRSFEIEAQTPNAADVGAYESALRQLPGVAEVQVHDLRAREGVTTFIVGLRFKPESAPKEAKP